MEAIVLSSLPYQETGRILTLFTDKGGVLSAIIKRVNKKDSLLTNVLSPLSHSHLQLSKGNSDLYQIQDASLLNPFLQIRGNLDKLTAAGKLLKLLKKSQFPEKPSPILFALTISYLKRLESSINPASLAISFQGKILRHEGIFPENKEESAVPLEQEEWDILNTLSFSKSFEELENVKLPTLLPAKINMLLSLSFDAV
jgi:DNA repair protein RecO